MHMKIIVKIQILGALKEMPKNCLKYRKREKERERNRDRIERKKRMLRGMVQNRSEKQQQFVKYGILKYIVLTSNLLIFQLE